MWRGGQSASENEYGAMVLDEERYPKAAPKHSVFGGHFTYISCYSVRILKPGKPLIPDLVMCRYVCTPATSVATIRSQHERT